MLCALLHHNFRLCELIFNVQHVLDVLMTSQLDCMMAYTSLLQRLFICCWEAQGHIAPLSDVYNASAYTRL